MAEETTSLAATAPVVGLTFGLVFSGTVYAYFGEVTGLGSQNAVIETRMVDSKGLPYVLKLAGALAYLDIHLRRGIASNVQLWNWRQNVVSGKAGSYKKSGSIILYNQDSTPVAQWNFVNGWPSRIEAPLAAADAATNALEEVVIVHEGITRVRPTPLAGAG